MLSIGNKWQRVLVALFLTLIVFVSSNASTFQSLGKKVDDGVIVAKINLEYSKDKLLNPFKIDVSSHDGYVTLQGKVKTDTQYSRAVMIAQAVQGVKDVSAEQLKVSNSLQPIKDTLITAKIKGKIIRANILGGKDVNYWTVKVETKNGLVFLSGTVDNQKQKNELIKLAQSVVGTKAVNSAGLRIK